MEFNAPAVDLLTWTFGNSQVDEEDFVSLGLFLLHARLVPWPWEHRSAACLWMRRGRKRQHACIHACMAGMVDDYPFSAPNSHLHKVAAATGNVVSVLAIPA